MPVGPRAPVEPAVYSRSSSKLPTFDIRHIAITTARKFSSVKERITSKIKHAIKLKTSPARLVQLLQPSLALCFSLQPFTAHWMVRHHWLQAKIKR